jgi:hypothetical protein
MISAEYRAGTEPTLQVNVAHRQFFGATQTPGTLTESSTNSTFKQTLDDVYPSLSFADELFWGATWLYRAAKQQNIRVANTSYYSQAMDVIMS